jgi:hypothetical protein|tara:strand:+ start:748 stop:1428 length:681 start_codon:yes stop_codon:yes gene_type:complete
MEKIKIFIGYDKNEVVAYHTCVQSIIENSSIPVEFTPINLKHLKKFYNRPKKKVDSTEFSISRFLVPSMSDFKGISLYVDCDFIFFADVAELIKLYKKNPNKSVWCVKHNYKTSSKKKFLGNVQYSYYRKNWSSFILFNNAKCKMLKSRTVEKANGFYLHKFEWLKDSQIASLPKSWNVLIGEQSIPKKPKAVHFTIGGPYFKQFKNTKMAKEWFNFYKKVKHPLK